MTEVSNDVGQETVCVYRIAKKRLTRLNGHRDPLKLSAVRSEPLIWQTLTTLYRIKHAERVDETNHVDEVMLNEERSMMNEAKCGPDEEKWILFYAVLID